MSGCEIYKAPRRTDDEHFTLSSLLTPHSSQICIYNHHQSLAIYIYTYITHTPENPIPPLPPESWDRLREAYTNSCNVTRAFDNLSLLTKNKLPQVRCSQC